MKRLKGVLFDVDGTLYHQGPLRLIMACLLLAAQVHCPHRLPRIFRIIRAYRRAQEELRSASSAPGDCGAEQIARAAASVGESRDWGAAVIHEWFEVRPLLFLPWCRRRGVVSVLSKLQQRGYRLGVFSDYPATEKLKALGVAHFFSTVLSSQDRGVMGVKPHTNGFGIAASRLGLSSSEVLYVGDRMEVDGRGAIAAGMAAAILGRHNVRVDVGLCSVDSLSDLLPMLPGIVAEKN